MRHAAVLLFALLAGCEQPKSSTLTYAGIAFDEKSVPTAFAIRVRNDGTGPVRLRDAIPTISYKTVIFEGEPPADFDYVIWPMNKHGVSLPVTESYSVPAGRTAELWYSFAWELPGDPPLMVAVVKASFAVPDLTSPKSRVETKPKVLLLQSRAGALKALLESSDPSNAAETAAVLEAIEGDRSESVELLMRRMTELANPGETR